MSQEKRPGLANPGSNAPILHRYDPRQNLAQPPAAGPVAAAEQPQSPGTTAVDQGVDQPPVAAGKDPAPESPAIQPVWPVEIGGPSGPEPTRYGDWERNGRVSDF
ncbi:MAG TPA: DUF1674 domain-containing protein [Dongiaceae bacterium]|nr:DUF1674 domain-containing protein [Dongiaceae bacterium]